MTQARLHERLLADGRRTARPGRAALLYKLYVNRDSLRVTTLADLLGVDAPTVTRKVQQLEHEGYVARHPDPDDRRATRIELSPAGRRTLQRVLDARRAWIASLFEDWDRADLVAFASALGRFSTTLKARRRTPSEAGTDEHDPTTTTAVRPARTTTATSGSP